MTGPRLRRSAVFHRTAFRQLVAAVLEGQACLRHAGTYWVPLVAERTFGIYLRSPDILACVQEQVEDYEAMVYERLLRGTCGRDGVLRPRTRLLREGGGTLRAFATPSGGADDE